MDRGLDWYKRDPRAMIDAKRSANDSRGMSILQAATYDLITDLIYEGAGETPNNPRYIASHFADMSDRGARLAIKFLIETGKLEVNERGFLTNSRAQKHAKSRSEVSQKRAKAGSAGGQASAKARKKSNKIKETPQANASSKIQAEKEKIREEEKEEAYASSKKKRGTRIREDWVLPKDWGEWALAEGWPEHAIRLEAQKFHDHWKAAPGQKGVKLDWQATWRNWMRNSKSPKNRKFGENDPTTTDPTLDAIAIAARMRRTSR